MVRYTTSRPAKSISRPTVNAYRTGLDANLTYLVGDDGGLGDGGLQQS